MKEKTRGVDGLLLLLLFGAFAAAVLLLLLLGARSYERLLERDEASFQKRICVQYIATKLRTNDVAGGVFLADFADPAAEGDTLYLTQEAEGERYYTRIYFADGELRELLSPAGTLPAPEEGNAILSAEDIAFSLADGLLTVETDGGSAYLALRSAEEAVA